MTDKRVRIQYVIDDKKLKQGAKSVTGTLKKLAVAMGGLYAVDKLGRAIAETVKDFAEFEKGLREVTTLGKFTQKELRGMAKETLKFSVAFNQTTDALNKARYDTVSAGFAEVAEQQLIMEAASRGAVAGVSDVATTVDILTTTLNAYGIEAAEVNDINDLLFTTIKEGKTTMNEIAASWGTMLPMAKAAKVPLREVGAAFAALTAAGIRSEIASTFLRGAIQALSAPTKAAAKAMKEAGISTKDMHGNMLPLIEIIEQFEGKDLEFIKKMIPDVRAASAIAALSSNLDSFRDKIEAFDPEKMTGATEEAFEKMKNTVSFQLEVLGKRWDAFWLNILAGKRGDKLVDILIKLNKTIVDLGEVQRDVANESVSAWDTFGNFMKGLGLTILDSVKAWGKQINRAWAAIGAEMQAGWLSVVKYIAGATVGKFNVVADAKKAIASFDKWFGDWMDYFENQLIGYWRQLATQFYKSGKNILGEIIRGVKDKSAEFYAEIERIAAKVRDYFPFSPAKAGPLRSLRKGGYGIMQEVAYGIYDGSDLVGEALSASLKQAPAGEGVGMAPMEIEGIRSLVQDEETLTKSKEYWEAFLEQERSYYEELGALSNEFLTQSLDAWGTYWYQVGAKGKGAEPMLKKMMGDILGNMASAFGQYMIKHGIAVMALGAAPPMDPAMVAAGAAQIAAGTGLIALGKAGAGAVSASVGGGSEGGGGGGPRDRTANIPAPGEAGGGVTQIININAEAVVDSNNLQVFVEDVVAPTLAEAIGRGTIKDQEYNIVGERD